MLRVILHWYNEERIRMELGARSLREDGGAGMSTEVRLETARTILRTVTMDDLEVVSRNWRLDECVVAREEAAEAIARMRDRHAQNTSGKVLHLCLAILAKDSDDFVGWCGLDHSNCNWPHPVLFYALRARFWGKGLATEAAMAVLEYAFDVLELDRVDAGAAADNPASVRVLQKLGMHHAGRNDEGGHAFTMTRQEHQEQNSARRITRRCPNRLLRS